jgi:hypothetical protein
MLNFVNGKEQGLFAELWEYFVDRYFSFDIPYLENFNLVGSTVNTLTFLIVGLTIGTIVAAIATIYNKRYIGDFVRKLIYEECFDKNSAKTLYDLGYLKSPGIRGVIKTGGSLSRWVRCVEEDEFLESVAKSREEFEELHKNDAKKPKFKEPEFKRDCNTMHFYLPEEKKYAAEVKFDSTGANFGSMILVIVVAVIMCAFIFYMLPDVIKMVDNFITIIKKG